MRFKTINGIVGMSYMCLAIVRMFRKESVFAVLLDVVLALVYLYLSILGETK